MSAFRGILTGYGMAAIKNKEAKDNAKMEIVKSAGIDFLENKIPQHEKEMKLYDSDYKAVELIHGTDIANLFGDAEAGFYGTGKGLQLVNQVLEKNNISKDKIKNFKFSTQDERIAKKKSAFQSKKDQVLNLTGIGGIGTETAKNQLEGFGKDDSMMDTQTQVTDQTQTTDTTTQDTEETPKLKADISSLFTPKASERGVETKFSQVVKAIEEQNGYADTMTIGADGAANFTWGPKRKIAAAHAQFATMLLDKDKNLDQNTAASAAKRYLVFYTEKPFKELENIPELKGSKYVPGDGIPSVYTGARNIDVNSVQYEGVSIKDFILNKIDNLPTTKGGEINEAIFQKFVENVPNQLMDGDISFRDSLLAQRQTQNLENNYFSLNN